MGNIDEDTQRSAIRLLMEGVRIKEVCEATGLHRDTVRRLRDDKVLPRLEHMDWRQVVKDATVPAMAIARNTVVIRAEAQQRGCRATDLASTDTGVPPHQIYWANKIVRRGCEALVSRACNGQVTLNKAAQIADLPHEQQLSELAKLPRVETFTALDDLRSRVSMLVDQKLNWTRQHGNGLEVFRCLRDTALASDGKQDLAEMVSYLKLVAEWCATIASILEGEPCSQQTSGQSSSCGSTACSSSTTTASDSRICTPRG